MDDLVAEFHKTLPVGSEVISVGHTYTQTDRQNGDVIRLPLIFVCVSMLF
jgi:hypothetical protein